MGDRVRVVFAGRLYLGVVSQVNVTPDEAALSKIREIREIVKEKQTILPSEIVFWRRIAEYYMCSVGEVFKAAYPNVKDADVKPRKSDESVVAENLPFTLDAGLIPSADGIFSAVSKGKTVLLQSFDSEQILIDLCLRQKGNVIWLVPEIKLGKAMQERLKAVLGGRLVVWGSNLTPAFKRRVTRRIREGEKYVLMGTRSALFLPHNDISLTIVSDENDSSYKQTSPAPRYSGRDAAVILSSIFGAGCVLESITPSLESIYNCNIGKYVFVGTSMPSRPEYEIIDTRVEARKNGMVGDVSRKLIDAVSGAVSGAETPVVFFKPRRAVFPTLDGLRPQLEQQFGSKVLLTDDLVETPVPGGVKVLAVFGVDALLGKQDFRADEYALQIIEHSVALLPESLTKVVIQTREASHPIFKSLCEGDIASLMTERREFSMPPFTRLVDICFADSYPDRIMRKQQVLMRDISATFPSLQALPFAEGIRIAIPKGSKIAIIKNKLRDIVDDFEKREKYAGHIFFDVDPM